MFGFSALNMFFFILFLLLTFLVLGHEVYIYHKNGDQFFGLAELGGLIQYYLPQYYKEAVAVIGVERFNQFLSPILSLPALFFTVMILCVCLLVRFHDFIVEFLTGEHKERKMAENTPQRPTYKDSVRYKRK